MSENKDFVDWVIPGSGELPLGGDDFHTILEGGNYKVTPTKWDENGQPTHGRVDRVIFKNMPAPRKPENK